MYFFGIPSGFVFKKGTFQEQTPNEGGTRVKEPGRGCFFTGWWYAGYGWWFLWDGGGMGLGFFGIFEVSPFFYPLDFLLLLLL